MTVIPRSASASPSLEAASRYSGCDVRLDAQYTQTARAGAAPGSKVMLDSTTSRLLSRPAKGDLPAIVGQSASRARLIVQRKVAADVLEAQEIPISCVNN